MSSSYIFQVFFLFSITETDNSVVARKESSLALGTGYRCGFYGVLHMEVFMERLEQEYGLSVIATSPTVPYRVTVGNEVTIVNNPSEFPDFFDLVEEPMVVTTIVAPLEYTGSIIQLAIARRATQMANEPLGSSIVLKYRMPLAG